MRRRLLVGGTLTLLGTVLVAAPATPAPAQEDEERDYITVAGVDLTEPMEVDSTDQPELYADLRTEVRWLVGRDAGISEPDSPTLGPEYEVVLHVDGEARHRFRLYPLAEGGPKVFRPSDQPGDESADEAWFLGRLSQPETLTEAGVPLTGSPPGAPGSPREPGSAGGGGEAVPEPSSEPDGDGPLAFLAEWREGMMLTSALALAVLAGVASIAFLLRRER